MSEPHKLICEVEYVVSKESTEAMKQIDQRLKLLDKILDVLHDPEHEWNTDMECD